MQKIPSYVPPTPVQPSKETYPPFLPCAGLTRRLLATLHADEVPPHGTLAYWCAEADNREDAMRYAGVVTYLLGIRKSFVGFWDVMLTPRSGRSGETVGAAELEGIIRRIDGLGRNVCRV